MTITMLKSYSFLLRRLDSLGTGLGSQYFANLTFIAAAKSTKTSLFCHAGSFKAYRIESTNGKNLCEVGFRSADTRFVAFSKALRNTHIASAFDHSSSFGATSRYCSA